MKNVGVPSLYDVWGGSADIKRNILLNVSGSMQLEITTSVTFEN